MSGFFKWNLKDLWHGAVTAAASGAFFGVAGIVGQQNFDLFTVDWAAVGHVTVNSAFVAFVGYMGKALVSDDTGRVFGRL